MTRPKFEKICTLPNGSALYREPNEVVGHRYWSDEIGGGVCVWDTSLTAESTLLAALTEEARRRYVEHVEKRQRDGIWQPIETAPRDGTTILVARWDHGEPTIYTDHWAEDCWCDSSSSFLPTHWMPAPPEPT